MNFLYPLLALGALAVLAPIILHLRRKSQERLMPFSAVRFLDDQPLPKASPLRLRDYLLFALRALAVFAIVAAFTWPFVGVDPTRNVTASRVYVLDATLSTEARGTFRKNKEAILKELRDTNSETQVAVVALTHQAKVLGGFGDDREAIIKRLEELEVSHQRGSYLSGLRQATSVLAQALGERREIVLAGDQQKNQWTENLNTAPFIPSNVQVRLLNEPRDASRPNLGLADPVARTLFLGNQTGADFSVKMNHMGGADNATVTLKANGTEVFRRSLDLKGREESVALRAQWQIDPKAWVKGEVEVTGPNDDLKGDDKVYFSIAPITEGRVIVLSQSRFLRAALAPEVMGGRWKADFVQPAGVGLIAKKEDFADALLVDASYLQSKDARELVTRYLSSGRGVLLFLNRVNPLVHGFLRELGFDVGSGPSGEANSVKQPSPFHYIAGLHPILFPFMSPDFGNLLDVKVLEHVPVKGEGVPLIFAQNGDPLMIEGTKSRGRLLLFAFGFERTQTDWATQPTFLPFLDLALQHARAVAAPQEAAEPGDAVVYDIPGSSDVKEVVLKSGATVLSKAPVDETRRATLTAPDQPGLYEVFYDSQEQPARMLAVNVPYRESDLTYTPEMTALSSWQMAGAGLAEKLESEVESETLLVVAMRAALFQQKYWWWLLFAAALALAAEVCSLYWRRKKV